MDNLRGSVLMIAAMAGFALEDMFIKLVSGALPVGQILVTLGLGGGFLFAVATLMRGERLWSRVLLTRPVLLRNLGELIGTIGYVTAITLTPLSSVSAILQATPLAVTLGAALFFGAEVGWRRWSAITVGFIGVLMIIRPGLAGFQPESLFAVVGVIGLAIRDLATRAMPRTVSTMQLSTYGFLTVVPAGLVLMAIGSPPVQPDPTDMLRLIGAIFIGAAGYYAITAAMRVGEIAVVTPFRYTRLLFALMIGIVVFGERPDGWTLAGSAVVILSGLYTLWRERRMRPVAA